MMFEQGKNKRVRSRKKSQNYYIGALLLFVLVYGSVFLLMGSWEQWGMFLTTLVLDIVLLFVVYKTTVIREVEITETSILFKGWNGYDWQLDDVRSITLDAGSKWENGILVKGRIGFMDCRYDVVWLSAVDYGDSIKEMVEFIREVAPEIAIDKKVEE